MRTLLLATAIAVTSVGPIAYADTSSSKTTTHTTTTNAESTNPEYSSTRTEQQMDQNGNVTKKTQTYTSPDAVTGQSSLKSSDSVTRPDGSTSTVDKERTSDGTYSGTTEFEKRTTTTTSP